MARLNLLVNPSWETGLHGWNVGASGGVVDMYNRETFPEVAQAGSYYCFARRRTAGRLDLNPSVRPAVTAGTTYTFSISVNRDGTGNCNLYIDWYNSSGGYMSTSASTTFTPGNATWHRFAVTATAPAGAVSAWPIVRFHNMQAWYFTRYDAAMFEPASSALPYGDGSFTGWSWTGTAHNSISQDLDPDAVAGPDQTVMGGDTVQLTASGSGNPEGGAVTCVWSVLDDGGTGITTNDIQNRTQAFPTFVAPNVAGVITIGLTVSDNNGNTDTDTVSITVNVPAPTGGKATIINGYANSTSSGGASVSVDVPNVKSGDWLLIGVGCVYTNPASPLAPSTSGAGTVSPITDKVGNPDLYANYSMQSFRKVTTGGGTHTVSTPVLDHASLAVVHIRNADSLEASVFSSHRVQSQSNNEVAAGPITTTKPDALVVGLFGLVHFSGSQTWTPPAGLQDKVVVADSPDGVGQLLMACGFQASAGSTGEKRATSSLGGASYGEAGSLFAIVGAAGGTEPEPPTGPEPGRMLLGG